MTLHDKAVRVDQYFENQLINHDDIFEQALTRSGDAGLAAHAVSPTQGAFLQLLVRISGTKRVLEIGTLGGYSTIWMARGLPDDGQLISLERDPDCVTVARANIVRAGLSGKVEIRQGLAVESLDAMIGDAEPAFDLVFIDADKPSNPDYLARSLKLSRPGTVVICDNVVRDGAVTDSTSTDEKVLGVRAMLDMAKASPYLTGTALQTLGIKGYDGFAIFIVEPDRDDP